MRFLPALLFPMVFHAAAATTWTPIQWEEAEVVPGAGKVKAALLVPIKLNGVECIAQLDTGSPSIVHYHLPFDPNSAREITIEAAGITHKILASPNLIPGRDGACKNDVWLSMGNQFFENGTLTFDLKKSRIGYDAAPLLATEPGAQPFFYPQWDLKDHGGGHVVIELRDGSGMSSYALFDTGAGSFGISATSLESWTKFTGLPAAEGPGVIAYKVNSWGKQVPCYQTRAIATFDIGFGQRVSHPTIAWCDLEAFKPPQKLSGLVGLRDLGGKTIVIDYPSRRWLIRN